MNLDIYCIFVLYYATLYAFNFFRGNLIGGVMVRMLASSVVDHGFKPRSGQTNDYKIGICCFYTKDAALMRKRLVGSESE